LPLPRPRVSLIEIRPAARWSEVPPGDDAV